MLHRSSSSKRRRASRSVATSSQLRSCRSANTSPGRRASIAVSPVESLHASGHYLTLDYKRSPRHSIIPNISLSSTQVHQDMCVDNIRPRHSLTPNSLSPRGSLVPDISTRLPRHSLTPGESFGRNSRMNLAPDSLSPRHSLTPDGFNRTSRSSLACEPRRSSHQNLFTNNSVHGSRATLAPDYNRSPRASVVSELAKSPRPSLTPSESSHWSAPDECVRSPRHSITPESSRSPRGSLAVDKTSPRGSIGHAEIRVSPRGSVGKGILAFENNVRTSRGSLTLTFKEPLAKERRSSADSASASRANQQVIVPHKVSSKSSTNVAYSSTSGQIETGSRRASSSVSQLSGDEQRRLCMEQKYGDRDQSLGIRLSLVTYGSVAYQLKDANLESTGTIDFVCKAINIVNRTIVVTVILVCLSTLPVLMLIMGIQFLRDCPREPNIPIYMLVGGSVGGIKMALVLYNQLHTRRRISGLPHTAPSLGPTIASLALTVLLIAWFILGNFWILRIKWPDYAPTLFEPNYWCHRTLYIFALVHIVIVYVVFAAILILALVLAACQHFGCRWLGPARYK